MKKLKHLHKYEKRLVAMAFTKAVVVSVFLIWFMCFHESYVRCLRDGRLMANVIQYHLHIVSLAFPVVCFFAFLFRKKTFDKVDDWRVKIFLSKLRQHKWSDRLSFYTVSLLITVFLCFFLYLASNWRGMLLVYFVALVFLALTVIWTVSSAEHLNRNADPDPSEVIQRLKTSSIDALDDFSLILDGIQKSGMRRTLTQERLTQLIIVLSFSYNTESGIAVALRRAQRVWLEYWQSGLESKDENAVDELEMPLIKCLQTYNFSETGCLSDRFLSSQNNNSDVPMPTIFGDCLRSVVDAKRSSLGESNKANEEFAKLLVGVKPWVKNQPYYRQYRKFLHHQGWNHRF